MVSGGGICGVYGGEGWSQGSLKIGMSKNVQSAESLTSICIPAYTHTFNHKYPQIYPRISKSIRQPYPCAHRDSDVAAQILHFQGFS